MTKLEKYAEAVVKNDIESVRWFLKDDTIEHSYNKGRAAKKAAENGHLELLKLLIDSGKVDYYDFDWTIKTACLNGHFDIVKLLFDDPKINIYAEDHWAIKMATSNGHFDIIKLLLTKYTVPKIIKSDIFAYSAFYGHFHIFKYLINKYTLDPSQNENSAIIETFHRYIKSNESQKIEELKIHHKEIIESLWNDKRVKNTLNKDNKEVYKILMQKDIKKKASNF